jgi:hypothetical protein
MLCTVKQLILHTGSFNGKDFKAISQVGPIAVWVIVSTVSKTVDCIASGHKNALNAT